MGSYALASASISLYQARAAPHNPLHPLQPPPPCRSTVRDAAPSRPLTTASQPRTAPRGCLHSALASASMLTPVYCACSPQATIASTYILHLTSHHRIHIHPPPHKPPSHPHISSISQATIASTYSRGCTPSISLLRRRSRRLCSPTARSDAPCTRTNVGRRSGASLPPRPDMGLAWPPGMAWHGLAWLIPGLACKERELASTDSDRVPPINEHSHTTASALEVGNCGGVQGRSTAVAPCGTVDRVPLCHFAASVCMRLAPHETGAYNCISTKTWGRT